ncbi:glycosyltransferase family 4 protein, partial [bacterium]|nr:glycosyltransferase family 4 protein [bacterium]
YPLGYVPDKDVDCIIGNACLVVSASLYEAGSGPGVDAWSLSTPVAFSNIEPFLEQLSFLGTKAWTFDPKDPKDIAKTINEALSNPEKAKQMAKESKEAIDKYTWDNVAEGYHKVFEEVVKK